MAKWCFNVFKEEVNKGMNKIDNNLDNEIMVSVVCLAYNHEDYIRDCLEGFISQKTDFKFEVIVHDDASTDDTALIISQYAEKNRGIIKPILQKENQRRLKGVFILSDYISKEIKGKYVALCEGDDFWTDKYKLQKQFDALENNPQCKLCLHKVNVINTNGEGMGYSHPDYEIETGLIKSTDFIRIVCQKYTFQTSSYFFNSNEYIKYIMNYPRFKRVISVGDEPYLLYFGQLSDVYYINEALSNYRKGGASSWSALYAVSSEKKIKNAEQHIAMFNEYDKYTNYKYHDSCEIGKEKYEYLIALNNFNPKILLNKRYKKYLKTESLKTRIFVYSMIVLHSLKKKINKGELKNNEKKNSN